jgi:hypothetical protein
VVPSEPTHFVLFVSTGDVSDAQWTLSASLPRFACATEAHATRLVAALNDASMSSTSSPAAGAPVEACQLCKKRKVKARVVLSGRVAMLCKTCTLEQIAIAKQAASKEHDNDDDDASGSGDENGGDTGSESHSASDGADGHHRRHRRHHRHGRSHGSSAGGKHRSRADSGSKKDGSSKAPSAPAPVPMPKGTILPKLTPAKPKTSGAASSATATATTPTKATAADAELDAKERSKQGFALRKGEADQYAWSSSEDDDEGSKRRTPIKVSISGRAHASGGDDAKADVEIASLATSLSKSAASPNRLSGSASDISRRRAGRNQQRKDDFSSLLAISSSANEHAPPTGAVSVLDLFDLSSFEAGGASLADVGDELLVPDVLQPTPVSPTTSTTNTLADFPDLDMLLTAPIKPAASSPTAATTTAVVAPAAVTPVVAPAASALPSNEPVDAASLMRQCKSALDGGDLATALGKAEQCVAFVRAQLRTADAIGRATLETQLAYAAKYVAMLRLTKAALAIGPPSVPSKRATALALIASETRVAAEHRAKAVRAAILRCGASKDFKSAASLLRLLLSTSPADAATLQQQLAKCEAEGEKNSTLQWSATGHYCGASLEPLDKGPALRCKMCGVYHSLEAKMLTEACSWCDLNELESTTL